MKRTSTLIAVLALSFALSPGNAQEDAKTEYKVAEAGEVVTIRDIKGVEMVATGFGKLFGPDYLVANRGEARVQIPFDRILSLEMGKIEDHRMPVTVTLTSGRKLEVVVDGTEFQLLYAGTADFGYFRMRFQDIREVTWTRVERRKAALGQRCSKGHIFYNDSWHFCPYDGEKLKPIRADE